MKRPAKIETVEQYLRRKKVTRCPTAILNPTTAKLNPKDVKAILHYHANRAEPTFRQKHNAVMAAATGKRPMHRNRNAQPQS